MPTKFTRVLPNSNGGWDVKRSDASRASKHFDRKKDAVDWGRDLSRRNSTEFEVRRMDGTIQSRDSHGNDPFPPKG